MIFLQIIVFFMELISTARTQENCESGPCYPTIGDLLVGRKEQLSASSTCGLEEPERYCIVSYLEDDQKCFNCDSRYPYDPYSSPYSHLIENVITTFDPHWKNKWWQSENGLDRVSIRLNLETLFQFSHLIITFKTFRPAAMLVERSRDFGKTWKVFRYFAQDCASAFPAIYLGYANKVGDVVCDSRYSDIEPSTEGEVILKALDPNLVIENPYDQNIQDIITITNLRINFTKLHTLGDTISRQNGPEEKYYYAIYEMVVRGNCFCNGHASQCVPVNTMDGNFFNDPAMVHGKCVCQHNTDGLNCEKCKEFYNDAPWRPAVGSNDHACRQCNCNGHSDICHFDMALYLLNGGTSGGVCEDCQHNTRGNQCDQCKPYFYHDPLKDVSDPDTCIPCDCDPEGTKENGLCECHTDESLGTIAGTCLCKENVEGFRCDQCKHGFFGLHSSDPLGCQYCNCNPFGSMPFSICHPVTGECQCQKFATGRYCEECLPGSWGLGNSLYACSACNCDIGGAISHLCSQGSGQCDCRPNIIGRQCNQPAPGYYFIPLDYYIYEAENAQPLARSASIVDPAPLPKCRDYFLQQGIDFRFENGKIILKKMTKRSLRRRRQVQEIVPFGTNGFVELVLRQPTPGNPVTWTGPGFARVQNGAGLRFTVDNIPFSMDFLIAIRFEPESLENWTAKVVINQPQGPLSDRCKSRNSLNESYTLHLDATTRIAILDTSMCLDPDMEYLIDVYFTQLSTMDAKDKHYILIDSLGLIPKIDSINNLCSIEELEEYNYYNCIEIASEVGTEILPDVCERLIVSMSARIHNGAVKCACNVDGSLSTSCNKFGGRCSCKPNVTGRCCNRCSVGSYGFGPDGCKECDCHTKGSMSQLCDQVTGQCACRSEIQGRHCDSCLPGYYGFPNCRPCQCNGNTELCDVATGACLNCRGFTNGTKCERCLDNYVGNPVLGQPCRPCMCPGSPTSEQYFAHSCYQDPDSLEIVCNCLEGYTGKNCKQCPVGYFGNVESGDFCLPCQCNNNTDITDPESCDKLTGECLKCLHNTYGVNCESCLPGFFGSAIFKNCTSCDCNPLGTNAETCSIYEEVGECVCDKTTGQCPCLPNVIGKKCDKCAVGSWSLTVGKGCELCDCNKNNSYGQQCNQFTGQCLCKPKYRGQKCDQCEENYYGNPLIQCTSCKCNIEGSEKSLCDKDTGICNCRAGVTGRYCDQCAPKYQQNYPKCTRCHQCFDPWDAEVTLLSQDVHGLVRLAGNIGPTRKSLGCDVHIEILQDKLYKIEKIFRSPMVSPQKYLKVKNVYDTIRQKFSKLKVKDHGEFNEIPRMNKVLVNMEKEIDELFKEVDQIKKKKTKEREIYAKEFQEALDKIRNNYKLNSTHAGKLRNPTSITQTSKKTREKILTTLSNLDAKDKLNLNKLNKMKSLDISKMNEMVCGTVWNFPCDIAPCGGALCRDKFGKRKCGGLNCNGALSIAKDALKKAKETGVKFANVSIHLLDAEKQIENIRQLAEDTKLKASRLNKTLSKAMIRMETDRNRSKELIKSVKDFLLDSIPLHLCPKSGKNPKNPQTVEPLISAEEIEKVVNEVLATKLPTAPYDLISILNKMKNYCDDYKKNKNNLKKQLEEVRKLTLKAKEAKKATENLPNGDDIRNNLKTAKTSQDKVTAILKSVTKGILDIRKKITEAKTNADKMDDKFKAIKNLHSKLETKIAELQDKMLNNRNQAAKAQKGANDALKQAKESESSLDDLKEKYELLKEKLKKKEIPSDILERVERLKKEAENMAKEIQEKFKRISDLEEKIDDLNQANLDKANELKELEEEAIAIRDDIFTEESRHANCKS
ncbi:laminin subunit beta-4 [Pelobates fuscus]|uniref:laminin subunit beta-4 n=1 Tax=Pelobates fuscus TaxID=191477 RepID=UPI002FE4582E